MVSFKLLSYRKRVKKNNWHYFGHTLANLTYKKEPVWYSEILGNSWFGTWFVQFKKPKVAFCVKVPASDEPIRTGFDLEQREKMLHHEMNIYSFLERCASHSEKELLTFPLWSQKMFPIMVFPFLPFGSFHEYSKSIRCMLPKVSFGWDMLVALQMVRAVRFLHENGVVHFDVKSENFFVEQNGDQLRLKLSDFDVSEFFYGENDSFYMSSWQVGTPYYYGPEMYKPETTVVVDRRGRKIRTHKYCMSRASDIFALGISASEYRFPTIRYANRTNHKVYDLVQRALLESLYRGGTLRFTVNPSRIVADESVRLDGLLPADLRKTYYSGDQFNRYSKIRMHQFKMWRKILLSMLDFDPKSRPSAKYVEDTIVSLLKLKSFSFT